MFLEHTTGSFPLTVGENHTSCIYLLMMAMWVSAASGYQMGRCSEHRCTSLCTDTYFLLSWIKTSERKDSPVLTGRAGALWCVFLFRLQYWD